MHTAACEAAAQLSSLMAIRPCGAAPLKTALMKTESAINSLSTCGGSGAVLELLLPCVHKGKKRLEVERSVEGLHKITSNSKSLSDMPRLESAILHATKVRGSHLPSLSRLSIVCGTKVWKILLCEHEISPSASLEYLPILCSEENRRQKPFRLATICSL